ncbi:MAG TPA: 4-hydroxythreonine-4-phosphate dehydrogenase PdxA, partial [Gemmatimonadales bacterium]|nr:4-hydroxythreonine-4-phosphate dehydrogenase PdxA [Gemmatimonadales bacterium]
MTKALALGPLDADLIFLGSGEQGAVPSATAEGTAPRSLLPEQAGRIAGEAVQEAVRLALAGDVDAIVTGPVHKHALHLAGFRYPGLTELLSHLAGDVDVAMMLATGA